MGEAYSSRQVIRVLRRQGFALVSHQGSHMKFYIGGKKSRIVIVPAGRKDIPRGTFRSILRQSGLTETDFRKKKR